MSELLWITILSAAAWLGARHRKTGVALVFGGLAALLVLRLARGVAAAGWLPGMLAGLIVLAVTGGLGWYRWVHHRHRVRRWGRAVRRKHGVASTFDVLRYGSAAAMRRQATRVRPSLSELPLAERLRCEATEFALPLCQAGVMRVWASIEDVVLAFGIPRYGKSGWLGCHVLDAPGAVVTTSTKTDLYEATHTMRAKRGPVWVFNPTGVGGIASTITFNPVTGCGDTVTAGHRAEDMLACGTGEGEREHWVSQARQVLAGLLHAAALGRLGMAAINMWVADPDNAAEEVIRLLGGSGDSTGAYAAAATQFFTTNTRTRSSITASMRPAFAWLPNPHARAATEDESEGEGEFNVAALLRTRGTAYLLGAEDGSTASLVAALTGYIAREARRIADLQPNARLDPSLLLALDEAALICPIPLDHWSADMGGRGIQIVACFQSRAQAIGKWGATGAAALINNAGAIVLFGGCKDQHDLAFWSTLFGERDEQIVTTDRHGEVASRSVRKVPVFSPAQLATLAKFRVVVWRSSMLPVMGKVDKFWTRPEHRALLAAFDRVEQEVVATATDTTRRATPIRAGLAAIQRRRHRTATRREPAMSTPTTSSTSTASAGTEREKGPRR